ncbi:MAG: DUF4492 domain-containing protein [Bacteroidetes bacterium RIFOXYB2_FULL_35_7]|nr:MAG: DUF4492 domain-containing protein [Bacteroidetes bacterium GWF2_35_48]OFY95750.1 MAG: DUF4492 domain-containing protein [Bacteroidetes bacterium RIFOXYB2_FULL_35_7]HBX49720.1 DUF4492 domain-containing protein [Bacteroidales bacterium]
MRKIFNIYIDGFRNITKLGKKLWILIFIKLFIMFVILKMFFFPNFLKTNFDTDKERETYVIKNLTDQGNAD